MKNLLIPGLFILSVSVPGYGQEAFTKTIDVSFTGTNCGSIYDIPPDVVPSYDTINGVMNVAVHKKVSQASFLWYSWAVSGCWSKYFVMDQANRYIEFRIRGDSAITKPISVFAVDSGVAPCHGEKKAYDIPSFIIPKANTWTIINLKIPPTTGGTQNILDTIGHGIGWALENGNYSFDYIKMGIAAIPADTILIQTDDTVYVYESNAKIKFSVSNHSDSTAMNYTCCGTFPDSYDVYEANKWVPEYAHVCLDVCEQGYLIPLLTHHTIYDSTFTNRLKVGKFRISYSFMIKGSIYTFQSNEFKIISNVDLKVSNNNDISIYPNVTIGEATIEMPEALTGEIDLVDVVGNLVSSQKVVAATKAEVDLSKVPPGMYFIKVSDGKEIITKKVIRQ